MSELPSGWVAAKLSELATPRGERVPPAAHPDKQFVGLEHVEAQSTRILGSVSASEVKSSASLFRAGDVLYGRLRPYLNKVAKPDFDGLASAEFIVFPDQPHLRSGFLKHRLNAGDFASFATHLNAGDRPRVDFEQIGAFDIALPPPIEQQRIVEKLEELLSDLDAGIAALERARAKLKRYRAAVLKAAVEGRLTEKWRAAHPKAESAEKLLGRILVERRKKWEKAQLKKFAEKKQAPPKGWKDKYIEPTKPDVASLPELPKGWCWATVDQASLSIRYGSSAKTREDDSGIPVLRMGNIQDGRFEVSRLKYLPKKHEEFPELFLLPGDILFNRTNSFELVGKTAVYKGIPNPCSYASYLIGIRPVAGWEPELLGYFINSSLGRAWIASVVSQQVGQANVNGTKLAALAFPLPPSAEQQEVVKSVEEQISSLEQTSKDSEALIARSARLRQAILKRAFEGKLVPQDPKDEPASELLARIRHTRADQAVGGGKIRKKIRQKMPRKSA